MRSAAFADEHQAVGEELAADTLALATQVCSTAREPEPGHIEPGEAAANHLWRWRIFEQVQHQKGFHALSTAGGLCENQHRYLRCGRRSSTTTAMFERWHCATVLPDWIGIEVKLTYDAVVPLGSRRVAEAEHRTGEDEQDRGKPAREKATPARAQKTQNWRQLGKRPDLPS